MRGLACFLALQLNSDPVWLPSLSFFSTQDGDSDDDDDVPVDFMGQNGMFEMTAYPAGEAGQERELNGGISGNNITTYGELNLVAEPQKASSGVGCMACKAAPFFKAYVCCALPGGLS